MTEILKNFDFPPEYLFLVEHEVSNIKPWVILSFEGIEERYNAIAERYPQQSIIPFAQRLDMDEVACWDLMAEAGTVVVFHDYSSVAWEKRHVYSDIWNWFRSAVEDMISFARIDIEGPSQIKME